MGVKEMPSSGVMTVRGAAAWLALAALSVGVCARTASAVEENKRPLAGRLVCTAARARTSGPLERKAKPRAATSASKLAGAQTDTS